MLPDFGDCLFWNKDCSVMIGEWQEIDMGNIKIDLQPLSKELLKWWIHWNENAHNKRWHICDYRHWWYQGYELAKKVKRLLPEDIGLYYLFDDLIHQYRLGYNNEGYLFQQRHPIAIGENDKVLIQNMETEYKQLSLVVPLSTATKKDIEFIYSYLDEIIEGALPVIEPHSISVPQDAYPLKSVYEWSKKETQQFYDCTCYHVQTLITIQKMAERLVNLLSDFQINKEDEDNHYTRFTTEYLKKIARQADNVSKQTLKELNIEK